MAQQSLSGKVPMGQKAAFGAGQFILNILPGTLGVFIQFFLLTAWGVDPFWSGLLGGLPRIFDSITDPIMGFISDNTKSRWGRRRPYIFSGAIVSGVLFFLMWQLDDNAGQTYIFWHVMVIQLLFLIGNTMFATPLVGLGYELTPNYNERTRLMAFANIMGQIAWMVVPWLYVVIPNKDTFNTQTEGVRTMALIVGAMTILLGILPAIFCKTERNEEDEKNYKKINLSTLAASLKDLWKGIVQVTKNKPFMKLCAATFLVFNGFQLVASFGVFIIVFYMYNGSYELAGTWPAWFNMLNAIITASLVIPIVSWMATKFGKRNAFIISTVLSIIGYTLKWWGFDVILNEKFNQTGLAKTLNSGVAWIFDALAPILESLHMTWFTIDASQGIPWLIFLPIPLFAFGMGSLFTLMMSMTADVCDLDELENGLPRKEGTFGAIYWLMVKMGQSLALVLGGTILSVVGFDPNATQQTAETMNNLRLADIIVPSLTAALAIWVMLKYDLDEEKTNEIQQVLAKRKAPKPSGYIKSGILTGINGMSTEEVLLKYPHFYRAPVDYVALEEINLRQHFMQQMNEKMFGICFTAFTEGQNPGDEITEEQVRRRLELIKPYTDRIRTFSCINGHERIPRIAREMGLRTMVGAWISDDMEQNEREIEALIALIKEGCVDIASVGNEVIYREELSEEALLEYIRRVKAVAGDIPVGYVDTYYEFLNRPILLEACDVLLINCYPFWEGAPIDKSNFYLQEMYSRVREVARGKRIIITETGWPSQGGPVDDAVPSADNAMRYFLETQNWSKAAGIDCIYFASFDESWKIHSEGWAGTSWGLWDAHEKMKFVIPENIK